VSYCIKRLAEVQGYDDDIGLVRSRLVTVLRRQIIAAVGDPVGRKANRSVNDRLVKERGRLDKGSAGRLFVP